ncbi:hypothetical protein KY228_000564, partial [Acinetobacter baumannii]|nr:hypothetical protein [Acinetobacter baumannii]
MRLNLQNFKIKELIHNKNEFIEIYKSGLTKDNLYPCSRVKIIKNQDRYTLTFQERSIPIFPLGFYYQLCDYFASSEYLWNIAQLQFTYCYSICGSAPLMGLDFKKALDLAIKEKQAISKFYLPESLNNNIYSNLVFKITSKNNGLQLEIWEYKVNSTYVYYIHALSENNFETLTHLDGATIEFTNDEIQNLLFTNEKIKGKNYNKIFRLDGDIKFSYLHEIAKIFLPIKVLYE